MRTLFYLALCAALLVTACTDDDPDGIARILFDANIPAPITPGAIKSSLASLAFGDVTVGQSADLTVTLTNTSTTDTATVQSVSNPAWVVITGTKPANTRLAPGKSLSFGVRFVPTLAQAYSGSLSIAFANTSVSSLSLPVTGTGIAAPTPKTTLTAQTGSSYAFGEVNVGSSASKTLTLKNTGSETAIGTLSLPAGFHIGGSNSVSISLSAQGSISYALTFAPTQVQSYAGSAQVSYNASNGQPLSLSVSGQGIIPPVGPLIQLAGDQAFSTTVLDFGQLQSWKSGSIRAVYIRNNGDQPLIVTNILSSNASIFVSNVNGFPYTLQPGSWLGLGVTGKNPGSGVTVNGSFTVVSNAPPGTAVLPCTVMGL